MFLTHEEVKAAASAATTRGATAVMKSLHQRPWAVVSNNSRDSIQSWFLRHPNVERPTVIIGRPAGAPELMKPSPWMIKSACELLDVPPSACVLIGDSTTDVLAARRAGAAVIGFANKPGKEMRLEGADALIASLDQLIGSRE